MFALTTRFVYVTHLYVRRLRAIAMSFYFHPSHDYRIFFVFFLLRSISFPQYSLSPLPLHIIFRHIFLALFFSIPLPLSRRFTPSFNPAQHPPFSSFQLAPLFSPPFQFRPLTSFPLLLRSPPSLTSLVHLGPCSLPLLPLYPSFSLLQPFFRFSPLSRKYCLQFHEDFDVSKQNKICLFQCVMCSSSS